MKRLTKHHLAGLGISFLLCGAIIDTPVLAATTSATLLPVPETDTRAPETRKIAQRLRTLERHLNAQGYGLEKGPQHREWLRISLPAEETEELASDEETLDSLLVALYPVIDLATGEHRGHALQPQDSSLNPLAKVTDSQGRARVYVEKLGIGVVEAPPE